MTPSKRDAAPSQYSREEMDAILQRALQRQHVKSEGVSHDELVAAAEEIGVPREELEAAARDLAKEKEEQGSIEEARRWRSQRIVRAYAVWIVMSAGMYVLSASEHATWWIWPVALWGVFLVMRTLRALAGDPRQLPPPRRVRETREQKRARRREEKLKELERKVEIGTDAVVRVVEAARGGKKKDGTRAGRDEAVKRGTDDAPVDVAPLVAAFDRFAKRGGRPEATSAGGGDASNVSAKRVHVEQRVQRVGDEADVEDEELDEPRERVRSRR